MLRRFAGALDYAAAVVSSILLVALLAAVALGALTRSLGSPFIWTDELSRFLMIWLAAFGWILATRKRLHVRIRFFHDLMSSTAHRGVEMAIQLAVTVFGALVLGYGIALVAKNHDLEATTLPISIAWMYVQLVFAGAVTAAQGARELFATLQRRRVTGSELETSVE